jgi:hypothetical protein
LIKAEDADAFANQINQATDAVVSDHVAGDVTHKEPFSDQLCGRSQENAVRGLGATLLVT